MGDRSEPGGRRPGTAEQALLRLREEVDRRAETLARRHGARLHCGAGCHGCCVDGLEVFEVEARRIARRHSELLERESPHPPGACALLDDDGRCRVYAERPLVCRTQGLPLRWLVEDDAGEIREGRDICPLNAAGPVLESLDDDDCWLLGPVELRLRAIQEEADGGRGRRVALRTLFGRGARGRSGPG